MSDQPIESEFLGITELALWLNLTTRHIRRLVAERRIPHHKLGGLVRFRRGEIEGWLDENSRGSDGRPA